MNTQLIKSKKFRAALVAAIGSLLTFIVAKTGWNLDVNELMTLLGVISIPFLIYIGAEGYSEVEAKKVVEENKIRKEISNEVIASLQKDEPK
jgi:accessory gene regulator protein AgrB